MKSCLTPYGVDSDSLFDCSTKLRHDDRVSFYQSCLDDEKSLAKINEQLSLIRFLLVFLDGIFVVLREFFNSLGIL